VLDDLVVVAGHCCLDIIPTLAALPHGDLRPGMLVEAGPAVLAPGGAVSNVGLALHRLGMRARLIGKIGNDELGGALLNLYRAHDPELAADMVVAPGEATSYSVVISPPDRDRIFLHCPGANHTFGAADVRDDALDGGRIFHFGYPPLMRGIYADGGEQLSAILDRAHAHGMVTALDMALPDPSSEAGVVDWRAFLYQVLPYVDLFLPSAEETLFMLDRMRWVGQWMHSRDHDVLRGLDVTVLAELADELLGYGAPVVGLKLGERGMYLRTTGDGARLSAIGLLDPTAWSGRELIVPCFAVDVAGTTGSGDATIAGFVTGMLHGLRPEAALKSAVAVGACSVEQVDATSGIPRWDAVQARLARGWPTRKLHFRLSDWRHDPSAGVWVSPRDRPI
jgi:sugar/nucleoside kinase (ribokinase family)